MTKMNPVVHFEMPYENRERLVKFYTKAFGWQLQKFGKEMGDYVTAATTETDENRMVKRIGAINGGFFPKQPDLPPQYPSVVISVDDIKKAMEGLLKPTISEKFLGRALVKQAFKVSKIGTIAGCLVSEGAIRRGTQVRLIRDGTIVYQGKISSLKRFKDDAREVVSGTECGIGIENFNDIKEGDVIEAFVLEETAQKLA